MDELHIEAESLTLPLIRRVVKRIEKGEDSGVIRKKNGDRLVAWDYYY